MALGGASACSVAAEDGDLEAAEEGRPGEAVESTSQAFSLASPELAAVLGAFHAIEIAQAEIALNRATNTHVTEFAQALLDYHTAANQQLVAMIGQTGVTPLDNAVSQALAEQAEGDKLLLEGLTGNVFDWTYVSLQIERHREFIAHLEEQRTTVGIELQPGISHLVPELRANASQHLAFASSLLSLFSTRNVPAPYYSNGYYGTIPPYYPSAGGGYYSTTPPYYPSGSAYYGYGGGAPVSGSAPGGYYSTYPRYRP